MSISYSPTHSYYRGLSRIDWPIANPSVAVAFSNLYLTQAFHLVRARHLRVGLDILPDSQISLTVPYISLTDTPTRLIHHHSCPPGNTGPPISTSSIVPYDAHLSLS
jgi:hypothetical protein